MAVGDHGIREKRYQCKRREDLEINGISCVWLDISQNKDKSYLIGNMYRPPDSRVELISQPTRVTPSSKRLIDHIY